MSSYAKDNQASVDSSCRRTEEKHQTLIKTLQTYSFIRDTEL